MTKRARDEEWIAGIIPVPAEVEEDGVRFQPHMLVWMNADGLVLGTAIEHRDALSSIVADSLRETIAEPMIGRPRAPARMRVATQELAEAVRAAQKGLAVAVAPTPEIDGFAALLREKAEADAARSYLGPGVAPDVVDALFRAAAALFRARPWRVVPGDQNVFALTIDVLGLRDAVVSVIGQMNESFGVIVFPDVDAFHAYLDAADAEGDGIPPHWALSFEALDELPARMRAEIDEHGWEVADPNAAPLLMIFDDDEQLRDPTTQDIALAEAVARAIADAVVDQAKVRAAFARGDAAEWTSSVTTSDGPLVVRLVAPHPALEENDGAPYGPLAGLFDDELIEIDDDDQERMADDLVAAFEASREGRAVREHGFVRVMLDYAWSHLGATIQTMRGSDLREVLFELFPRKVMVDPPEAGAIVDELRAFFSFLKRERAPVQVDACLRVLDGDAAARLASALGNRAKFGMAKSMVAAGADAGFDMRTEAGTRAWMQVLSDGPAPSSRAPRTVDKTRDKSKSKRKAARKARKKRR